MRTGNTEGRYDDIVAEACPGFSIRRTIVDDDPRRRVALLVGRGRTVEAVLKVGDDEARGASEQQRLRELADRGVTNVPRPLGAGTTAGRSWSVESFAPGDRWDLARRRWRRRHERDVLDAVARWLDDLGARTAHDRSLAVPDAPAVLVHGDLASGTNVLVNGAAFTVIDWETATDDGTPLVDLLPTLALALARTRVGGDAPTRARYVLELCRGETDDSAWLFGAVARHLRALDVAPSLAGPLALAAWRYQGSMRARHDELVRAAGQVPVAWTSPAELVFDAWVEDAALGVEWPALGARTA